MKGKLPEGWKEYQIKEIGRVVTGSTPPKINPEYYGGNLPWIKPPDLDNDSYVSTSSETISEVGKRKVRLLPKGTVLVSCIGNIGKVAIAETEVCTNQQINSIIPHDDIVNSAFLYYTIKKIRPYLESIASSAVVPLLNKSDFSNITIALPPLDVQQKIVSILEKAEETKRLRAQADELTQQLLKSVFLEMFGDPGTNSHNYDVVLLKNVLSKTKSGTKCGPFGSALKKEEYTKSGIPVWTMDNIQNNKFIENNCLFISKEKYHQLEAYSVENGDIIISRAGTVGKMCVINTSAKESIISTNLIRLSFDKQLVEPVYFTCLMEYAKERIGRLKRGEDGAYTFMNTTILSDLKIPLPPFSLQQKFAAIVEHTEKIREQQAQSSLQINTLFDSLMQKAFTGELVS